MVARIYGRHHALTESSVGRKVPPWAHGMLEPKLLEASSASKKNTIKHHMYI